MSAVRCFRAFAIAGMFAFSACSAAGSGSSTGGLPQAPDADAPPPQSAIRVVQPAKSSGGYLYAENNNSTIGGFAIAKSGALTALSGSPYASNTIGPGPFAITVDPKGPYVYTTGSSSNNVELLSIGSAGVLSPVRSILAGTQDEATVLAKADNRLYVVTEANGGGLAAFDIKKGGKLKAVGGSPYPVTCPGFCTAAPITIVVDGSFAYSIDQYGWYVSAFSVAQSGALTELNSYATGEGPNDAVLSPNGHFLYVTNGASGNVSAYTVAGGVLTQLTGSPFAAGGNVSGVAVTRNGRFLYVANQGDGTVSGYAIAAGGALSALPGSPFADGTGSGPSAMTIDHADKHLFVGNLAGSIAVYTIGASGSLTQIAGSPFADSGGPRGLALYEP